MMDASTGRTLGGLDHLRQSVTDILTTRIGTRVELRDYGSDLPRQVDRNVDGAFRVDVVAAAAAALAKWEPRLVLTRVDVDLLGDGGVAVTVVGIERATGSPVTLDGIRVS